MGNYLSDVARLEALHPLLSLWVEEIVVDLDLGHSFVLPGVDAHFLALMDFKEFPFQV